MADAKQGNTPMEDFYNGSSQSRVVLAKPRLGGFGASSFASGSNKTCNPFGSILRPSQLKPGGNPFLKVTDTAVAAGDSKDKEEGTEERCKDAKEEPDVPKFVPLGSTNVTARTANPVPAPAQPAPSSSGFVFGQNLSERVVMQENLNNGDASSTDHSSTNGTAAELLFTSAAASVKENQEEASLSEGGGGGGAGLAAAAAEYERSHARPPPPAAGCTLTGEEDETNVLQISCRLFAWETGSWRERGRGVLRLNDAAGARGGPCPGGARLVARVAGSLRVVLNTKLWPDMVVERAGTKSLRITAVDAQNQVKLFLIMGAPGDIVQLHRALMARIAVSKRSAASACSQNAPSQRAAERLEADADEYLDKADDEPTSDTKPDDEPPSDNQAFDEQTPDQLPSDDQAHDQPQTDSQRLDYQEYQSHVDGLDNQTKSLKRKEPAEDETTPKKQCPEIVIE